MKIKICGLFREADIDLVNEAGPDYIGFVFAESRRQVSAGFAARLRARLTGRITPVGVFADAPPETIRALYQDGVIAMAQLHGGEDEAYIAGLKDLCSVPVIKAFQLGRGNERAAFVLAERTAADYVLFDQGGGTGTAFDWGVLGGGFSRPWFLAGGIGGHNIDRAVALGPYGVDVSSGAETNGFKDLDKIMDLIRRMRGAQAPRTPRMAWSCAYCKLHARRMGGPGGLKVGRFRGQLQDPGGG
ncbi:MAG: phosphoribosylanthranilate isomerase [Treponema sp.]|nr:phosphoribosylanthranilate isomerase [Treponema sp.]